jgi:hypothetical protein
MGKKLPPERLKEENFGKCHILEDSSFKQRNLLVCSKNFQQFG